MRRRIVKAGIEPRLTDNYGRDILIFVDPHSEGSGIEIEDTDDRPLLYTVEDGREVAYTRRQRIGFRR